MPFDATVSLAEPMAVAGGGIFVPAGLLANSPTEAAFALKLAHAIAHIALRHPTRMATRAEIVETLPPPATIPPPQSLTWNRSEPPACGW